MAARDVSNLQLYLNPKYDHLLDWFQLAMRLTVLTQTPRAPHIVPERGEKRLTAGCRRFPAQRVMRRWLVHDRERGKDFCDGHGAGIRYIGQRARAQVGGTAGSRTIHLRRSRTRHFRRAGSPSPAGICWLAQGHRSWCDLRPRHRHNRLTRSEFHFAAQFGGMDTWPRSVMVVFT
jgi:hypothetical protein